MRSLACFCLGFPLEIILHFHRHQNKDLVFIIEITTKTHTQLYLKSKQILHCIANILREMNLLNQLQAIPRHKPYSNVKVCYSLWYKALTLFLQKSRFSVNTINERNSLRISKKVFWADVDKCLWGKLRRNWRAPKTFMRKCSNLIPSELLKFYD